MHNLYELEYYDSTFCAFKTYMDNQCENIRRLKQVVSAERASSKNLQAEQGKLVSEILLSNRRQKLFAPITADVEALQPLLNAEPVNTPKPSPALEFAIAFAPVFALAPAP